jgi:hypothetical protein
MERGAPDDLKDAADICVALSKDHESMKHDFREHVAEIALDILAKQGRIQEGHGLLDALPQNTVSRLGMTTLRAKLYRLEDKHELASTSADEALKEVSKETSPHDIRRLATLLWEMGRHKDALPLLQQVTISSVATGDTRRLLACASRLGRHDIMLETFQQLRSAGAVGPDLLENELQLLETYDTAAAITVMQEEIAKTGDKTLRLRLSYLGLALDRQDLVERIPPQFPLPMRSHHAWECERCRCCVLAGTLRRQSSTLTSFSGNILMTFMHSALRNALQRTFGLNVVGFVAAVQTIDAWLKSK